MSKNIHMINGRVVEVSSAVKPIKVPVKSIEEELNILDIDNYNREDVVWIQGRPYAFRMV